jgi:hypothetical protein
MNNDLKNLMDSMIKTQTRFLVAGLKLAETEEFREFLRAGKAFGKDLLKSMHPKMMIASWGLVFSKGPKKMYDEAFEQSFDLAKELLTEEEPADTGVH